MKRLLFIQLASTAELIIMTPIFNSIKKNYPNCEIDILCLSDHGSFLDYIPNLNNHYFVDTNGQKELLTTLNNHNYDAYIDIQRKLVDQSTIFAKKIKSDLKIGYNKPGKQKPFTESLNKSAQLLLLDHYLKCLPILGIENEDKNYQLNINSSKSEKKKQSVLFHLESQVSNLDRIIKLKNTQLIQLMDFQFICHESEIEWARQSSLDIQIYSSHAQLIDFIAQTDYLVSGQSDAVQLADFFKSPVVYLSNGTDYNRLLASIQKESVILTARSKKNNVDQISLDALIQGIRSVCGFI